MIHMIILEIIKIVLSFVSIAIDIIKLFSETD
ncbi:hypothetical protein M2093_002032 [Breznakia sp. PH1-1]|nr:hypothetical protein [Breznakia sp. PH1-1]MDH6404947.1 hypothetical protein [Breznakia sp. PF1-11]MDH6412662.1 hypothetical protein [Breznakia sp. PFB1-11]MDH6415035.1 hypothetical protein [Breznakia sp. PFB1-14]MDH6417333.1 hypothetical protein [Breznakia sp. PFB1-4]MDH6419708.1 hypothetical protein [Breznakia sp. PFB1-12]MDH6474740.1 hypothetical protein [Breznakia sp. PFB2-30]MDH6477085.1 hypothetical protein [Breznakia sp. PFB1-19]